MKRRRMGQTVLCLAHVGAGEGIFWIYRTCPVNLPQQLSGANRKLDVFIDRRGGPLRGQQILSSGGQSGEKGLYNYKVEKNSVNENRFLKKSV